MKEGYISYNELARLLDLKANVKKAIISESDDKIEEAEKELNEFKNKLKG